MNEQWSVCTVYAFICTMKCKRYVKCIHGMYMIYRDILEWTMIYIMLSVNCVNVVMYIVVHLQWCTYSGIFICKWIVKLWSMHMMMHATMMMRHATLWFDKLYDDNACDDDVHYMSWCILYTKMYTLWCWCIPIHYDVQIWW